MKVPEKPASYLECARSREHAKAVSVYFVPGKVKDGRSTYVYAVVRASLNERFLQALQQGIIPDFAVVVESGYGEPTEEVKQKMKKYYGFDHDDCANENYELAGGEA